MTTRDVPRLPHPAVGQQARAPGAARHQQQPRAGGHRRAAPGGEAALRPLRALALWRGRPVQVHRQPGGESIETTTEKKIGDSWSANTVS